MNKFKIGDYVKVKDKINGHMFKIGEIVKIIGIVKLSRGREAYRCKSFNTGFKLNTWCLAENEIERIKKSDEWKVKIKINYEFDEETKITNCRITGGREEDSIYGIMDLIFMLYNKVEDKKCLIRSIRVLLDNIEKGKYNNEL